MSRQFASLEEAARFLTARLAAIPAAEIAGFEAAATMIEEQAKSELGNYQPAAGPFAAWPELADSTKADRSAHGYPENEPLLRDGTLRDSIEHSVDAAGASVGSNLDIAVYQELGTSRMPPRSFLGSAAVTKGKEAAAAVGAAVVAAAFGLHKVGE